MDNKLIGVVAGALAVFVMCAAWLTHVIWVIRVLSSDAGATVGQAALGIIGAFMPPIGVIHGLVLWFS